VFTPGPGNALADITRQGVENFVSAQKALLDVFTKPRTKAVAAHAGAPAREEALEPVHAG